MIAFKSKVILISVELREHGRCRRFKCSLPIRKIIKNSEPGRHLDAWFLVGCCQEWEHGTQICISTDTICGVNKRQFGNVHVSFSTLAFPLRCFSVKKNIFLLVFSLLQLVKHATFCYYMRSFFFPFMSFFALPCLTYCTLQKIKQVFNVFKCYLYLETASKCLPEFSGHFCVWPL